MLLNNNIKKDCNEYNNCHNPIQSLYDVEFFLRKLFYAKDSACFISSAKNLIKKKNF